MIAYIEFVLGYLSEEVLPIGTDDLLLLTVGSDDEVGLAEYALEGMAVIHEHITGRGAQEELDTRGMESIDTSELIRIVIAPAEEEGVVRPRCLLGTIHLPLPGL